MQSAPRLHDRKGFGYRRFGTRGGALVTRSFINWTIFMTRFSNFVFCLALVQLLTTAPAHAADDFISGDVKSADGAAQSGVWVIAETSETPTPYRKIVVTDDAGRFVLPQLPNTNFDVWVRGYGLLDSDPVTARAGTSVSLKVEVAESDVDAAQVYPANYWLSLLEPPPETAFGVQAAGGEGGIFGGKDDAANVDPFKSQEAWLSHLKLDCVLCHQLGAAVTRLPNAAGFEHGFPKAGAMKYFADRMGTQRLPQALGKWGAAIAAGAAPQAPPRPSGIERNLVITQWAWGDQYSYAHDEIATDKRNVGVNAGGPVYGIDLANDYLLVVDPNSHSAERIHVPTLNNFTTPWCEQTFKAADSSDVVSYGFGTLGCPWPGYQSAHAGAYRNPANPHNPMMDANGKVWLTTQVRRQWAEDIPKFCQDDPAITANRHHRQLGYYDPQAKQFELIDTCYGTHHLQFDADGVLWTSGDDYVVGWFDPAKYDPKDPATLASANGHSEVRLDTDGDGKADRALVGFHYGVIPNPVDSSVWSAITPGITSPIGEPGYLLRYDRETDRHEAFAPPHPGMGPRGVDVDSQGIIWTALAGSGHLARFDRSRCAQTWGDGQQCPEGWSYWRTPGPVFKGMAAESPSASTDMHYYLWVDQFDTFGLGRDVVIVNGTNSDSLLAFVPASETFVMIRIPYPLNTYTRGLDGRIDDAATGWKGRGLWFTNGLDPIIHSEVPRSYAGQIQIRPDPLAH